MTNILVNGQCRVGAAVRETVAAPEPGATTPVRTAADRTSDVLRHLDRVHQVLETARSVIDRGWLQNGWYRARPAAPPPSLIARLRLVNHTPAVDEVHAACLVAAVALAADHGGSRPDVVTDAGPALDVVWDTLQADDGRPGPDMTRRVAPPAVRTARMRDLVRWNDAPGRSRQDVLGLLDRAISRTILTAASTPARATG